MRHRLGMSRRDLIRRGAIVGGTLIWTIPVVKTINSANAAPGSPTFSCCICKSSSGNYQSCKPTATTEADCAAACNTTVGSTRYEFQTGPNQFTCKGSGFAQAQRGCFV